MNTAQCLMARAGLSWSIAQLAVEAGVNYSTIVRLEAGKNIHARSREKIETAFTAAGAVFVERAGRVGVAIVDKQLPASRNRDPSRGLPSRHRRILETIKSAGRVARIGCIGWSPFPTLMQSSTPLLDWVNDYARAGPATHSTRHHCRRG